MLNGLLAVLIVGTLAGSVETESHGRCYRTPCYPRYSRDYYGGCVDCDGYRIYRRCGAYRGYPGCGDYGGYSGCDGYAGCGGYGGYGGYAGYGW